MRIEFRYSVLSLFCGLVFFFFPGFAKEPSSESAQIPSAANPAIVEYEPALAIRASACITCHAKIRPSYITDFGHGDRYFFGNQAGGGKFGTFNGHIYGDFYGGEPNKTGWLTAEIERNIIVPQTGMEVDLRAEGAKLSAAYKEALNAKSLAGYLKDLENQKKHPATVLEKRNVFIGAPDAFTLRERFGVTLAVTGKYIKTDSSSPALSGFGPGPKNQFLTNTGEIVCDGDFFVDATVFLNGVTVATKTGCRIYSTKPIFVQGEIQYKNLGGKSNLTNLQLVSSEAILLGVGDKSCDPASKESPLSRRLVSGYAVSTFMTRRSPSPESLGKYVYAQALLIPQLEDAGCHSDKMDFTRLLLNAPQVHSRYKGNFKGLIIAELALFRLSNSNFEFDPVFKAVPVLPRLKFSDYLVVE